MLHSTAAARNGQSRVLPVRFFRCLFVIEGQTYHIIPLHPDPEVASKAYRFKKPDGTTYDVRVTEHGPACECLGFLRWKHCKHIRTLQAMGMIPRDHRERA